MKDLLKFGFIILAANATFSCSYDKEVVEPIDNTPIDTTTAPIGKLCDTVIPTYDNQVQPIINASCATATGCHITGTDGNGIPYTSFADIKAKVDNGSFETKVLGDKSMPAGGGSLTDDELEILQCWIDKGALEN